MRAVKDAAGVTLYEHDGFYYLRWEDLIPLGYTGLSERLARAVHDDSRSDKEEAA